jgi:hypothetical protein
LAFSGRQEFTAVFGALPFEGVMAFSTALSDFTLRRRIKSTQSPVALREDEKQEQGADE